MKSRGSRVLPEYQKRGGYVKTTIATDNNAVCWFKTDGCYQARLATTCCPSCKLRGRGKRTHRSHVSLSNRNLTTGSASSKDILEDLINKVTTWSVVLIFLESEMKVVTFIIDKNFQPARLRGDQSSASTPPARAAPNSIFSRSCCSASASRSHSLQHHIANYHMLRPNIYQLTYNISISSVETYLSIISASYEFKNEPCAPASYGAEVGPFI